MTETAPRAGLKIKTGPSITGGSCCPHCGGLLSAEDTARCPHCQRSVHAPPATPRLSARGPGFFAALTSLLVSIARFVLFLVVVAVLAVGGSLAYQRWWPGAKSSPPASPPVTAPCALCQGSGQARCSVCGGAGSVDGMLMHTPCDQCGGTGKYQQRLKKGVVRCPFCRGTGTKESFQARMACATCGGKGVVACASCAGTGRASASTTVVP